MTSHRSYSFVGQIIQWIHMSDPLDKLIKKFTNIQMAVFRSPFFKNPGFSQVINWAFLECCDHNITSFYGHLRCTPPFRNPFISLMSSVPSSRKPQTGWSRSKNSSLVRILLLDINSFVIRNRSNTSRISHYGCSCRKIQLLLPSNNVFNVVFERQSNNDNNLLKMIQYNHLKSKPEYKSTFHMAECFWGKSWLNQPQFLTHRTFYR